METLILIIHIIAAISLILFILLQSGKGGGVSAAFGGGAGAALGQRSAATVLGKLTVGLAITFGITSMTLAVLSTQDRTLSDAPATAPASSTKTPSNTEAPKTASPAPVDAKKAAPAPVKTEKAPAAPKENETAQPGNEKPAAGAGSAAPTTPVNPGEKKADAPAPAQ